MKIYSNILILLCLGNLLIAQSEDDPYLWLENIDGDSALNWVKTQNKSTLDELTAIPQYKEIYDEGLAMFYSKDRIVSPSVQGNYVYNYWKDEDKPLGIWRRTTKKAYLNGTPQWETMLDVDSLCNADSNNWTWNGYSVLYPEFNKFILWFSPGGGDADIGMEYDPFTKTFVKDGFQFPISKGNGAWLDTNTMLITRDLGEGTLSKSGYPKQVRIWKRGTAMEESQLLYETADTNMGVGIGSFWYKKGLIHVVYNNIDFYRTEAFVYISNHLIPIKTPLDAHLYTIVDDEFIFQVKQDWKHNNNTYQKGTILSAHWPTLLTGELDIKVVQQRTKNSTNLGAFKVNEQLIVHQMVNVKSALYKCTLQDGEWKSTPLPIPRDGAISVTDISKKDFFYYYDDYTTPYTLNYVDEKLEDITEIARRKSTFADSLYHTVQYRAISKDGTEIPYSVVKSRKEIKTPRPTMLYGYGGFESSLRPGYLSYTGKIWLDRGGVYVEANIRGGGEYGPEWHQAGLKENRQRVYDDFHAVAEDLINRGITTPQQLGINGGSNGGLLVAVAFTQRPDLYGAVICNVPLLDMKRYNKLLAGASWEAEYGNPDVPEEWEYLKKYSPYHNLKKNMDYPEVYFCTSTRDDRVHPGHARKMAAKMKDMGYKVYYYENTQGGHGGSITNEQSAHEYALMYTYLLGKLKP